METYVVLLAEYEDGNLKSALVSDDEFNDADDPSDFFFARGLKSVTVQGKAEILSTCSLDPSYLSD